MGSVRMPRQCSPGGGIAGSGIAGGGLALPPELLAGLPVAAAYLHGPDLVVGFANDRYQQLIGGPVAPGETLERLLPDAAAAARSGRLRAMLGSGEPSWERGMTVGVRDHGGQPVPVLADVFCQPVREAGGAVTGVLLLASEVTGEQREPRALSEQLQAVEGQYRDLFRTLPLGVIHYSADGVVLEANAAATEMIGIDPDAVLTWPLVPASAPVRPDGASVPVDEFPVVVALRTGKQVRDELIGVRHAQTGELRWLETTAVPYWPDDAGRPRRAYALLRDMTAQRRMEQTLRSSTELMGLLREANVLGVTVAEEGRLVEANDAYLDIIGYSRQDLETGSISWQEITPPEWVGVTQDAITQLRSTGACLPFEKECVHRAGYRVPILAGSVVTGTDPLRWVSYVIDLSARQRAEAERAREREQVRQAQAAAARAQEHVSFLAQAGTLLAAAEDWQEFLRCAASLVVPSLADFCIAYVPDYGSMLRAACIAYRDTDGAVGVCDLYGELIPQAGDLAVQAGWMTRAARLVRQAPVQLTSPDAHGSRLGQIIAGVDPDCLLATPLMDGQDPVGVLAIGRGPGRACLSETSDVPVMDELARQVAAGLGNAARYARDHTVAETLQRAMLPSSLPSAAGLELAVRYLPATQGAEVGGDWYDAFTLPGGQIGLAVGDVIGHNIAAASVMSQVRTMLRAYAIDRADPAEVMTATGAALAALLPEAMATAVYAVLDLPSGTLRYASAGHLPPACVTSAGQVSYLRTGIGTMLGVPVPVSYTTASHRLAPGSRLLFYTDGLVEDRGHGIEAGLSALSLVMRHTAACTAEQTCATVQAALPTGTPRADDICLLAARLTN